MCIRKQTFKKNCGWCWRFVVKGRLMSNTSPTSYSVERRGLSNYASGNLFSYRKCIFPYIAWLYVLIIETQTLNNLCPTPDFRRKTAADVKYVTDEDAEDYRFIHPWTYFISGNMFFSYTELLPVLVYKVCEQRQFFAVKARRTSNASVTWYSIDRIIELHIRKLIFAPEMHSSVHTMLASARI